MSKDRTETIELTVLCLIEKEDQILLQNRVKKDWQGYTLPGGHVEPGESVVDTVIREIREETGLTVEKPKLCGIKQFPIEGGRYLVFLFKANRFSGELCSGEEGQMHWVRRRDLPRLPTVEDFSQLLSVFDDDKLTEFQYVVENDTWNVKLR